MSQSRRNFLLAAGGAGLALVAVGGVFVATRRPSGALKPWEAVSTTTPDVRLDVLRHAILAPNPHNRQPWQIRLVGGDEAVLTCDLDRRLDQTDPHDRQITIGFGCFLELARIAAAERGYRMETVVFPAGEPQPRLITAPVAHLRFVADAGIARDPLYGAITKRRSSKVPFDTSRVIEPSVLAALANQGSNAATISGSSDAVLVADLRRMTWHAWMIEATTQRTWMESVNLMRIGRAEIEANPDGIALGGSVVEILAAAGQITRSTLADPNSRAFRSGSEKYSAMLAHTPAYIWVSTPANTRTDQIAAGRAYVRANLAATAAGIAMHPVSQALQEFPEMTNEFSAIHHRLGVQGPVRIQMLARIGYAGPMEASARWPLEAKLSHG